MFRSVDLLLNRRKLEVRVQGNSDIWNGILIAELES
jgi:hypothetical protein